MASFNIGQAVPGDVEEILALLKVMHAEIAVAKLNEEKALKRIRAIVETGGALIIRDAGRIVASVGLMETDWWFSDQTAIWDSWFFVHPDHRKSGHARALLYFAKQVGKVKGIPVVISVATTKDTLRKLKFFRKYMTPFGGAFIHGVKT